MNNYTARDVVAILQAFVLDHIVEIPAKHIDGDYLIPLGELEYAVIAPNTELFEQIAATANGE